MSHFPISLFTITASLFLLPWTGSSESDALQQYLDRPDDNFSVTREHTLQSETSEIHVLRLTSQEWRGIEWNHRLTVILPPSLRHPEAALLHITGGSNRDPRPLDLSGREMTTAIDLATRAEVAVAILEQVPNQPLLHNLYEDDLIAYTFAKRLETGELDWPLLFPMVKSATRAMDAITEFLHDTTGSGPESFILTGASKRGWTAWLTAASDSRVIAIAPMVFDILNFAPQLELQRASFDGYSEMIRAYEEQNLFALLGTEAGATLGETVDPFTHRDQLDMPKLILLGTNDPYWSVDAARLYFRDLPGHTHLFYAANSGHRIDDTMQPTLLAFVKKTLNGSTLPGLDWERTENGKLSAHWNHPQAKAWLWTAHSPTRNFTQAQWTRKAINGTRKATATLHPPAEGFTARYIEVRFPAGDDNSTFGLCTEIAVTATETTTDAPFRRHRRNERLR